MIINIATDFSDSTTGRYIKDGDKSGEEFLNDILYPKYKECIKNHEKITINFDGTFGYTPSFLEESFGGLVRKVKKKNILNSFVLISEEDLSLVKKIYRYVKEAEEEL